MRNDFHLNAEQVKDSMHSQVFKKSCWSIDDIPSRAINIFNKDGSIRQNSAHNRWKQEIENQEAQIERLKEQIKQIPERIDISLLQIS